MFCFSDEDKTIIKHYHEKGYTSPKIWKDNPNKYWDKTSVKRLINRFEGFGTTERQKWFWCLQTEASPEEEAVKEMICSQESVKVMVPAALAWFGVTQLLFINKKELKVNSENYPKHFKK